MRTVLSAITIFSTAAGWSAAASHPPRQSHEEGIVIALTRHQFQPHQSRVCLADPIQAAPDNYLGSLTATPARNTDQAMGYYREARRLSGTRARPLAPIPISIERLRPHYPNARFVEGPECGALLTIFHPIISDGWGFLIVSFAQPCASFSYRISLIRHGLDWTISHVDQLTIRGGPPGCADQPWNAPSGLRIRRIQLQP